MLVVHVVVRYESQIVEKPYFKARESGQSKQAPRLKTKRRAASSTNHMPKTRFLSGSCHPMKGASLILPISRIFGLNCTCRKEDGKEREGKLGVESILMNVYVLLLYEHHAFVQV